MSSNYRIVTEEFETPGYHIAPFAYQASGITFSEWANLFTLCLAPLIAHVFGGVPKPVFLSSKSPRWHERLWQYNPTSILWRYFVITDRRIRAKSWTANDMAASNAYFWTGQGWDGSVQMLERSRAYCVRLPTHHRVRWLSGSTLLTLIITLQGVMAIKTLVDGINNSFAESINIGSIFSPLAVFGLLRIFAAMWLTDDYLYLPDIGSLGTPSPYSADAMPLKEQPSLVEVRDRTTMSLLDSTESSSSERFRPTHSWRGIVFRLIYLLPVGGLLAICLAYLIPQAQGSADSLTTFLMVVFYTFFLAGSMFLYGFYFLGGRSTSSIIPCHNALWYKLYTGAVTAFLAVLVLLAALETRATPCGIYTTYPNDLAVDMVVCAHGLPLIGDPELGVRYGITQFGVADHVTVNADRTVNATRADLSTMKPVVIPFTGLCFGDFRHVGDSVVTPLNDTFLAPA